MKQEIKILILFLSLFIYLSDSITQTLHNGVGYIPEDYQVEWADAGLMGSTPTTADHVFNINDYTIGIYKAYGASLHDIFDNDIGYNSPVGVLFTNASDLNVRF